MVKYWLRNRLIYSVIVILLLSAIASFFFVEPNVEAHGENRLNKSVYEYSQIDFDIPSPTKEQLAEIEELDCVEDAFGYYYTESDIKINNKSVKSKMILSDDLDALNITMFNQLRLISESSDDLVNPLYIDYAYQQKHNLSLGDIVYFNNIEFQVGRVYETNTYYGSAIFVPLVGEQKQYIESRVKSYSGAYLKVNDVSKADAYLRNYKPLGRLKSPDSFATEEEYLKHYNAWNNASYYNEITLFASKLSAVEEKSEINYFIGYAIVVLGGAAANILLSLRKSEKEYFSKKKVKKQVKIYYIISAIFDFVFSLSMLLLGASIAVGGVKLFVPTKYITNIYISAALSSVVIGLIAGAYNLIFYKKTIKNS